MSVSLNYPLFSARLFLTLHLGDEALGGLKAGEVVGCNYNRSVFADVASSLFGAMLHNKRTETTQIDILFLFEHAVFDRLHKCFYSGGNIFTGDTCFLNDILDNFCFCHLFIYYLINFGMQRYCFLARNENLFEFFSIFLWENCCRIGNYDFREVGFRQMGLHVDTDFNVSCLLESVVHSDAFVVGLL